MPIDRIADMTHQELEDFVVSVLARFSIPSLQLGAKQEVENLLASMRTNIIQTKPGDPTPTQLLKEDRDQWYRL